MMEEMYGSEFQALTCSNFADAGIVYYERGSTFLTEEVYHMQPASFGGTRLMDKT
jgi:hypothetical protein